MNGVFITPDTPDYLKPNSIGGVDLYMYCNNNPVIYVDPSGHFSIESFAASWDSITKTICSAVDKIVDYIDIASTIQGLYSSASSIFNHVVYFAENLEPFADDMKMLGTSMLKGVLAFNEFSWGLEKSDIFGVILGVGLDVYDSIQRGVSVSGIILGGTLTAAKSIGLVYLNKGILYATTAIGSFINPGVGTVVGFAIGAGICIAVDIVVSNWLDDLIDEVAK